MRQKAPHPQSLRWESRMAPIFLPSAFGVVATVLKITILQKFGSMTQKSARLDIFCGRISSKIQGKKNSRRISSKI